MMTNAELDAALAESARVDAAVAAIYLEMKSKDASWPEIESAYRAYFASTDKA